MELKDINHIEQAGQSTRATIVRLGIGLFFIIGILLFTSTNLSEAPDHYFLLIIAAMIGGYMAMNIGANDVANNVGPAVG